MVYDEPYGDWPVPLPFLEPDPERLPRERTCASLGDCPRRGFHPDFILTLFNDPTPPTPEP